MVNSVQSSQTYSVIQQNTFDRATNSNIVTTKFEFDDTKLKELSAAQKAELEQKLLELSRDLNKEMQFINTNLMFDYNDSISSLVLTVKQRDTGEVIRQIPTDEAMELMKKMRDVISVILDTKG